MFGLKQHKTGWIGVDVGTSHLKVAQVSRTAGSWRLSSAAIVPRNLAWDPDNLAADKYASTAEELLAAADLRRDLAGRRVAATLPMAVCQVHQVEGNLGSGQIREDKLRKLVESSTCESANHLQCAAWPAESEQNTDAPLKSNIITVPTRWTDHLGEDIARCGWSCQTIDGLPLALSRAVVMTLPAGDSQTWAALDWGYTHATFCVVHQRRPVYVRCLKDCGFRRVLDALVSELGISANEALQLLEKHNLAEAEGDERTRLILDAVSQPLDNFEFEMQRTLSHLRSQRRGIVPTGVFLFGGGSAMCGIDSLLSQRLELDHRVWHLPTDSESSSSLDQFSNLLGPAIALSALAWEKA